MNLIDSVSDRTARTLGDRTSNDVTYNQAITLRLRYAIAFVKILKLR